jgi:chromosome segregation ATPase
MRKLERSNPNRPNPDQVKAYNQGRVQAENDRLNQQHNQLWQQIEEDNVEKLRLQQEVEQTSALVRQEKQEKQGILQRLMDAIASRNSMRGRLGNMTAQRNKATEQLKVTMDRLVEANQQVGALQQEYDQDMEEMAKAYQEMSPEQRSSLPPKLRHLLDQVAKDYEE